MKVLLTTLNSKYSHINISGYYLKHCIENICDVLVEQYTINDTLDNILEGILWSKCDLVCFGCYIWNIEQTKKVIQNLHQLRPEIQIALGGPEVSYNPQEVLQDFPFLCSIMCGEGENNIKRLIIDLQQGSAEKIYSLPVTADEIPTIADDIVEHYDNRVVYFETSRGCPYRCSYCLSCIDKNIKYFDLETSKNELKKLLDKNVKQIRFIDRTFNSNRKRAISIWNYLIEHRKDTTFHFEICVNLIDEETMEFLKTVPPDVFQFEIGVQSTNEETLVAINRGYHWEKENVILRNLRTLGTIKLHTDLIIGLPYETYGIFKDSFNALCDIHPHEVQIGFLKLLKGSDIYSQKEKFNYIFTQEPPYEVLENQFISYEEVRFLKRLEEVFELFCNSGYFNNTIAYLTTKYADHFSLYEDLTRYFLENHYFSRKISTEECYHILYSKYQQDEDFLTIWQLISYDYFLKYNGHRDFLYHPHEGDALKEILSQHIEENREQLYDNKRNSDVYKKYRFLVLDYDIAKQEPHQTMIYTVAK